MSYGPTISRIRDAIEEGYYDYAVSELFNNRMGWNKWLPISRAQYLIDQLGVENVKTLYLSCSSFERGFLTDKRVFTERRVAVLKEAYDWIINR